MIELNIMKQIEDKKGVIHLEGDLDQPNAKAFLQNMKNMINENQLSHIFIDLNNLSFLDSVGIGSLLELQAEMQERNGVFCIVCTKSSVLKVLQLSGLWSPDGRSNRINWKGTLSEI